MNEVRQRVFLHGHAHQRLRVWWILIGRLRLCTLGWQGAKQSHGVQAAWERQARGMVVGGWGIARWGWLGVEADPLAGTGHGDRLALACITTHRHAKPMDRFCGSCLASPQQARAGRLGRWVLPPPPTAETHMRS